MLHFECRVCQPNLHCSAVFSAEICSFCKNSANPNISRKICSASRISKKNQRGLSITIPQTNHEANVAGGLVRTCITTDGERRQWRRGMAPYISSAACDVTGVEAVAFVVTRWMSVSKLIEQLKQVVARLIATEFVHFHIKCHVNVTYLVRVCSCVSRISIAQLYSRLMLSAFLYVLLLYDGVRNYCIKEILYTNWTPQCEFFL